MEKNINNIVFVISNLIKNQNSQKIFDSILESIIKFIKLINENNNNANIFFLLNKNNEESYLEDIKLLLKNQKLKIRENNINFIFKKDEDVIDVDSSFVDIIDNSDFKNANKIFSNDDTLIIYSDISVGEITYLQGYYSVFIYSSDVNGFNKEIKEIENLSNKTIDLLSNELDWDSLNYDFISFLESKN